MKKILFILIIIFTAISLFAQKFNIEPGITIGSSYYLGDINHTRQFYSPGLTIGLACRHSFNEHYAVRLNILKAKISGNDADFPSVYQQTRGHTFINNIYEIGLQAEFNFFEFNSKMKKSSAPYITAGLALAVSNSFHSFSLAIPMGIGYKYSVTKRLTLSAEWVFRNTTTDNLDLLIPGDTFSKQLTKRKNFDWYSIAGLTITYNFASDKMWCPAYPKQNEHYGPKK